MVPWPPTRGSPWRVAWMLALLLAGCRPEGPTVDAAVPVVAADAAHRGDARWGRRESPPVATHRLGFGITQESACSQSWDVTSYTGNFLVRVDQRGGATADLDVRITSTGGSHGADPTHLEWRHECRWTGAATEDAGALVVQLAAPSTDGWDRYPCRVTDPTTGKAMARFELRCTAVRSERWPTQTLACSSAAAPWLLETLRGRDALPLGTAEFAVRRWIGGFSDDELTLDTRPAAPRL